MYYIIYKTIHKFFRKRHTVANVANVINVANINLSNLIQFSRYSSFLKNTHSQCVLPNSNPQATCKQANSHKEHPLTVYIQA